MRLVLQRVSRASVRIDGSETRSIGRGLVALAGMRAGDNEAVCSLMADKMARLRIFDDQEGNLNLSLLDVGGDCLLISNFTLYARCRKGRRPAFVDAAPPGEAKRLYECLVEKARELGIRRLETGEFGAHMDIEIAADGPVTILLDSDELGSGNPRSCGK